MNDKNIPLDYANGLVYELEKAFWDERGKGARFRMTNVGQQFFNKKILPLLTSSEIDHILQTIQGVLQSNKIVGNVSYNTEDRLLRVRVEGCIHRPVEERMTLLAIEPFTCVPANLIVMAIEQKLNIPAELAEIKVEEGACQLLLVMFEKQPALD
jgi:hypothetical protein